MKNKLTQIMTVSLVTIFLLFIVAVFTNGFFFILLAFELVAIGVSIYLLLFDNRNSKAKVAWILALYFIPVLGVLLYLLLGRDPRTRRLPKEQIINQVALQNLVRQEIAGVRAESSPILARKMEKLSGRSIVMGNDITILSEGNEAYQKLFEDLRNARNHIHLFYFIFKADEVGQQIKDILIDKALAGVEVRFMYDSLGSIKLPFTFISELRAAGVEVRAYDPVNSFWLSRRLNWRNHRKVVVIDGKIGHTGGLNIGNEYRSITEKFSYWRDTNIRIKGPLVCELQESFLYDWIFFDESPKSLDSFFKQTDRYFSKELFGTETGQVVYGGPYDQEKIIREGLLELIDSADDLVQIATPYFVPDDESLAVLRRVALSGVKVQLLIPGKGDREISFSGTNSFIDTLLNAGIEVYQYDNTAFLHCKLMIIDGKTATIGSTNFDIRSFQLNHEISVFLYGPSSSIDQLTYDFQQDLKKATAITESKQLEKNWQQLLKEKISALFVPLL